MRRLMRTLLAVSLLAFVASSVAADASVKASRKPMPPRWVRHVRNYRGGLSGTVRISLAPAVIRAQAANLRVTRRLSSRSFASPSGLVNVQANTDTFPKLPQDETSVAVSTRDPLTAVAASNDYINGGLWIGTTHDGGKTWSSQFLASRLAQTGDFCTGGDPSVVYSARDRAFYASQLCFFRIHPESAVAVFGSKDGGNTWTGARYSSQVISNVSFDAGGNLVINGSVFYDKELLAVDNNPSSPHYGRLWITYVKFHLQPTGFSDYCPAQFAYTDNVDPDKNGDLRDTLWTNRSLMPDNPGDNGVGRSANQDAMPVVDNQGGLDVSFSSEDCNTALDRQLLFRRVLPNGDRSGVRRIDHEHQWKDNPDLGDVLAPKIARIPLSPSMAFNPKTGALEYVVMNNVNSATSGADISYAESFDYGGTWSDLRPVSVDGSGNPAPQDQFFPWIAAAPNGVTHIIWFDNRNDSGNQLIETFGVSTADTTDFTGFRNLSTASWDPNNSFFTSGAFFGDYNGLAVGPGVSYPVWTDGRNSPGSPLGDTDIFTIPN